MQLDITKLPVKQAGMKIAAEESMNEEELIAYWPKIRAELKKKYFQLTTEDLELPAGNSRGIYEKLARRLGRSGMEVQQEIELIVRRPVPIL